MSIKAQSTSHITSQGTSQSSTRFGLLTGTRKHVLYSVMQIIAASCLLAICARITVPLYFSPVPISAQTFAVMFIGATLGRRKGFLSVLTYIAEGCMGLPVFAGGSFGILTLLGRTGGYFVGFLVQVYLVGWFFERRKTVPWFASMGVLTLACALQLACGALWLSYYVGLDNALMLGVYPFILGELLKSAGIVGCLKAQHR